MLNMGLTSRYIPLLSTTATPDVKIDPAGNRGLRQYIRGRC